jgi:arginyl-tRNA synthetase
MYEKEGALWFRSTDFGDEKDRVVIRANGAHTYFASDIAYHYNKAERGFDRIINIFGSDHHGYTRRVSASFEALGNDPERLQYLLVQFAILYRGQQKLSMSTRGGNFVTLRELREEVGNDAARFFYVLRKPDQHMEFDLELAKSQSSENPVYYIQYAHARVCSVFRQLEEKGMKTLRDTVPDYKLLVEPQEEDLLKLLSRFPEVVELSAITYEPHQLAYYLRDLANAFHTYYNAHPFLSSAQDLRIARLGLIDSTRIVIRNGLDMLGVSAPVSM